MIDFTLWKAVSIFISDYRILQYAIHCFILFAILSFSCTLTFVVSCNFDNASPLFKNFISQANGELYYFASLTAFGIVAAINPSIFVAIYEHHGEILGGLNIVAMSLCFYLLMKAKQDKNPKDPYLRTSVSNIIPGIFKVMNATSQLVVPAALICLDNTEYFLNISFAGCYLSRLYHIIDDMEDFTPNGNGTQTSMSP